jgi:hypothetical protein
LTAAVALIVPSVVPTGVASEFMGLDYFDDAATAVLDGQVDIAKEIFGESG